MKMTRTIRNTLLTAGGALVITTLWASFQPADAGPIIRNRIKGAVGGAVVGGILGNPAAGARIGRAVGTVKGIKKRRSNRRARLGRRR